MIACSTPKKAVKKPAEPDVTVKDDDKVRVYDPATGTYILVPRDAVKVDTMKWTEEKTDPLVTDQDKDTDTPDKKSEYEVSLLIPLNSLEYTSLDGYLDPKLVRFLQYYGGMRIAAEEIREAGLPINFHSFDTENSISQINAILSDRTVRESDIIIGPYDKEYLERVAAFGEEHEKFVISPWLPAFNIDEENPFFIQVVPGLETHAQAIMNYMQSAFDDKKIFLVSRNNPAEIQRLALFKNNPGVRTEDLIIDDESIDLAETNLSFLLDDPDGTVFMMPYYSRQDENFVNSFMRKLHADKGTKEVIVFGLPQWTGFNNLNSNYMESLNVHISSPTYVDRHHASYRSFRNKFFQQYFTMPDNQAYQGYDLLKWLAGSVAKNGLEGLIQDAPSSTFGVSTGFNMKPVYREGSHSVTEMKTPLYYENSKVRILAFRDQDFELVW